MSQKNLSENAPARTDAPAPCGKHAYMIMAHNEWDILKKLITLLDNEKNDIFVHIDKKVKTFPELKTTKSTLRFVPDEKRVDTRWGTCSVVHAELTLLEFANSYGPYCYYHLISGVDLPIKSNANIHDFFEKHNGKNFIGFARNNCEERLRYFHFFVPKTRTRSLKNTLQTKARWLLLLLQRILHISRNNDIEIRKGELWISITEDFAKYCIAKKDEVFKRVKHTLLADETVVQTLIWNSPFRATIYDTQSEHDGCQREIDWNRGSPYVWGQDKGDFAVLMKSRRLFARKFSSKFPEIINEVFENIKKQNENAR